MPDLPARPDSLDLSETPPADPEGLERWLTADSQRWVRRDPDDPSCVQGMTGLVPVTRSEVTLGAVQTLLAQGRLQPVSREGTGWQLRRSAGLPWTTADEEAWIAQARRALDLRETRLERLDELRAARAERRLSDLAPRVDEMIQLLARGYQPSWPRWRRRLGGRSEGWRVWSTGEGAEGVGDASERHLVVLADGELRVVRQRAVPLWARALAATLPLVAVAALRLGAAVWPAVGGVAGSPWAVLVALAGGVGVLAALGRHRWSRGWMDVADIPEPERQRAISAVASLLAEEAERGARMTGMLLRRAGLAWPAARHRRGVGQAMSRGVR